MEARKIEGELANGHGYSLSAGRIVGYGGADFRIVLAGRATSDSVVEDRTDTADVVAKQMVDFHSNSAGARLRNEIAAYRLLSRSGGPFLVPLGAGEDNFLMPYLPAGACWDLNVRDKPLQQIDRRFRDPAAQLNFLQSAYYGLKVVHGSGIVHRDLKPSNLMFNTEASKVIIIDFSHALVPDGERPTAEGRMVGTPPWLSPVRSQGVQDFSTDVYELSLSLSHALTGFIPDTTDSRHESFKRQVSAAGLHPSVVAVLLAGLTDRGTPSAGDLVQEIQRSLAGLATREAPDTPRPPGKPGGLSRRALVTTLEDFLEDHPAPPAEPTQELSAVVGPQESAALSRRDAVLWIGAGILIVIIVLLIGVNG